jgi:hypothetical protein
LAQQLGDIHGTSCKEHIWGNFVALAQQLGDIHGTS